MKHATRIPLTTAEILALVSDDIAPGRFYFSTDERRVWIGMEDQTLFEIPAVVNSGPIFYGDYPNDTIAGQNGVPIGGVYFLTPVNGYGQPGGQIKKRVEQPIT